MIDILVAENSGQLDLSQRNFLRNHLPASMIARADKFMRWQDSQAYMLGKFALTEGLKKYGFDKKILNEIQVSAFGRPYIRSEVDFNISHSGAYVVCAISDVLRVGIDIEEIRDIDINDFRNQFNAEELHCIDTHIDRNEAFFRFWTRKEALIKADGRGLFISVKNILTDGSQKWCMHEIEVAENYITHLATDAPINEDFRITRISIPRNITNLT